MPKFLRDSLIVRSAGVEGSQPAAPSPTPTTISDPTPSDPAAGGTAPSSHPGGASQTQTPPATPAAPDPAPQQPDGGAPKPGAEPAKPATLAGGEPEVKPQPAPDDPKLNEVPEDGKYELQLPDGAVPDEQLANEAYNFFKEKGYTRKEAQRVADALPLFLERQQKAWQETVSGWAEQARKDPDLARGGFEQNVGVVRRAVVEYGTPGFRQLLNEMGIGNHPEVIKTFFNIGKSMGEASTPGGGAPLRGNQGKPRPADVLFGEKTNAGTR